ncbi:putative metal-dependent hydrolase [Macrococcoides canis]|uniref:YfiT family bacillithiol transferase n=1 Tax=Macrococcoides canis TaxID=1855823 RepID=UPI0020B832DE|nr:putative metal-dependent hydrolase [Macrococcus canis]UTH01823.1 putative metal-dependent hydrolase [Macrococcus canis]
MTKQYPIGKYVIPTNITETDITSWIEAIANLPEQLRMVLKDVSDQQLSLQYREGSWDVRTLVHHIADSHIHGYQRTKLILTEDNPAVSTFEENEWVLLEDDKNDIDDSLQLITGIHNRWTRILINLTEAELNRTMQHPDNGVVPLKQMISLYAWHGKHHLEHIKIALRQE